MTKAAGNVGIGADRGLRRVANLLPPSYQRGYTVPPEAVAAGFTSEVITLANDVRFINELDRSLAALHFIDAGLRAEAAGCAAVFINTVGDYGLRELRAAVGIPVVGAGQAAFQLAAGLGDRFGVLTVWPESTRAMYRGLLEDYGLAARCAGVRHVLDDEELWMSTREGGFIDDMSALREAALTRLVAGGNDLLGRGADVIALGCTCMTPARLELQQRLGVPVIDPIVAAHKTAELLVTMGLSHRAAPVPSKFAGSVAAMVAPLGRSAAADDVCGQTCSILAAPAT